MSIAEDLIKDRDLFADAGRTLIIWKLKERRHEKLDRELKKIGQEMIFTPSGDPHFDVLRGEAARLKKKYADYQPTEAELIEEAEKVTLRRER